MDARITKKRLGHLLSYDWVKILLTIVAAIVVWSLVFTMTATRITVTQRFIVQNYLGVHYGKQPKMYDEFSYEILEGEYIDNMRGGEEMFYQLVQANLEVGDGDVMLLPDYPVSREVQKDEQGNELKDADGNPIYQYGESHLEKAIASFGGYFSRLDDEGNTKGYFTQMKEYLSGFFTIASEEQQVYAGATFTVATFDENSLNEQAVKDAFRQRVKKDKRFKKEEQIIKGEQQELKRLRSYLAAYNTFFEYLSEGKVSLTYLSVEVKENYCLSGVYGINLCPNEKTMGGLKEQFYYTEFDGTMTAKNIHAMFMDLKELDKNFQYENLLYLNALIADVYTEA